VCLGLLYRYTNREKKALEIWKLVGERRNKEYKDKNNESGVRESIELLSTTSSSELVFSFSSWVFERDKSEGIKIFTNEEKRENGIVIAIVFTVVVVFARQ